MITLKEIEAAIREQVYIAYAAGAKASAKAKLVIESLLEMKENLQKEAEETKTRENDTGHTT